MVMMQNSSNGNDAKSEVISSLPYFIITPSLPHYLTYTIPRNKGGNDAKRECRHWINQ